MIGSSKILTVSYGTFSCTLEGFDDSFGTMKAIAEYFRDLAADDRYFGAEPATPDADMLAKIAGREIKQQVEARIEDGSVTLRPSTPESEPAVAAALVEQQEKVAPEQVEPETTSQDDADILLDEEDDATQEVAVEKISVEEDAQIKIQTDEEITDDKPVDSESVAAKLRRIRAVVAKNKAAVASGAAFSEDQHAEEFLPDVEFEEEATAEVEAIAPVIAPKTQASVSDIVSDIADEPEFEADIGFEDEIEETVSEVEETDPDDLEDDNDAMASIMDTINAGSDDTDETSAPAEELIAEISADLADVDADLDENDTDDVDFDLANILHGHDDDQQEEETGQSNIFGNVQDTLGQTELSKEDEADLVAELANVELESSGPESSDLESNDGDLGRDINKMLRSDRANRALHDDGGVEDEAAMDRLLDETNAKLDTDDSTRRRSVISHLRAAVAATVADRKINPKSSQADENDDTQAYRMDLADVVAPEKSDVEQDDPSERPSPLILVSEQRIDEEKSEAAPAPSEPKGPISIRPRRIIKTTEAAPKIAEVNDAASENRQQADIQDSMIADSTSFADFAEKMGASELPDILEAAAAYNAFVQGQPNFRRPQIMRQAASFAGKDQFNREEGLRSFGQLLRQGKIIKVERGRFEIAGNTRFKPADRIAGE